MLLSRPALRSWAWTPSTHRLRFFRRVSSSPPLISIQNGTFYRHYPTSGGDTEGHNPPLFPNLNFVLPSEDPRKQHWAVVGAAGRTTLFDVFRGRLACLPPTARSYPYLLTDEIAQKDPRLRFVGNAIQHIGFASESSGPIGGTRGAYLSARYESYREESDWTVRQFLKSQTSLNPLEGEEEGKLRDYELLEQVVSDLRLGDFLDMPVANLSNGQTRRARIAKALLNKPELLLLDEPFMGLDPATVRGLSTLLRRMAEKSAPRLILGLRPQDNIPDWVTHVLVLGNSNEVLLQGTKDNVEWEIGIWKRLASDGRESLDTVESNIRRLVNKDVKLDRKLLLDLKNSQKRSKTSRVSTPREGEPLIEMDGVHVQYDDTPVLGDWAQQINGEERKGLHWTVRRGQRWAIVGANGSGKTTLLSLITSDHPQAYALPVRLFGRSRLPEAGKPGLSLFDLQSRMGHSSPEIHALFPRQLSIRQAVESAFADTFLSQPKLSVERDQDVNAALRFFRPDLDARASSVSSAGESRNLPKTSKLFPRLYSGRKGPSDALVDDGVDYADEIRFADLNVAQQRLVLFLRAIIHKPDLVILDEPFSGMSPTLRNRCINFLEVGELRRGYGGSTQCRTSDDDTLDEAGSSPDSPSVRHRGLSDNQALIVVAHVKDEIPSCVRHFMRLPCNPGDEDEALDFRLGALYPSRAISDNRVWEALWAPASTFAKYTSPPKGKEVTMSRHPDDEKFLWDYL